MRTGPSGMGIFYLVMGILFTYLAINSADGGIWSFPTILLMVIATFDFVVAIRMFSISRRIKNMKQNKKDDSN
ncbi:YdiK family protein [Metabacillus arenae]|uniref:YdiK family protein n=1 Tax=Metabacillus arenae TaxID=2771434 RepID=A0A926NF74_9BACI|nr:YdiK family protein [Metabacillus arenae]MBD1383152.1 YdiK family protein [Metabacillus arenae]